MPVSMRKILRFLFGGNVGYVFAGMAGAHILDGQYDMALISFILMLLSLIVDAYAR